MKVENRIDYEFQETDNVIYEEVKLEDFDYEESIQTFYYPCPCGDIFEITLNKLFEGENICTCPSCSLTIKVIYDIQDLNKYKNL